MKAMPKWAWAVVVAGGLMVIVAAFVPDGTYAQSVMVQLGSAAMLVAPIVLAERAITRALDRRFTEDAAVARAEDVMRIDDLVLHLSQSLDRWRPPPSTSDHLGRMLLLDGWRHRKDYGGYALWTKSSVTLAVPLGSGPLKRGTLFGILRDTGWTHDRYLELHGACAEVVQPSSADED